MSALISRLSLYTVQKVNVSYVKWAGRVHCLFLLSLVFFWGKEFHGFATASAQGGFEAADQSVLNEDCYVRLYLSVVLKYHQCHSTGSGHNDFSCVSRKKIRDTPCKEHTGSFLSLAGCTGRHKERKIIALS